MDERGTDARTLSLSLKPEPMASLPSPSSSLARSRSVGAAQAQRGVLTATRSPLRAHVSRLRCCLSLVPMDDSEVISFLLQTEIIPLCSFWTHPPCAPSRPLLAVVSHACLCRLQTKGSDVSIRLGGRRVPRQRARPRRSERARERARKEDKCTSLGTDAFHTRGG
jgi:hypothetical protein